MNTNYTLIADNKKAKRTLDLTVIPQLKDIILDIIVKDYENWHNRKLVQPGIELNNLVQKISALIKVNRDQIMIALQDLEYEQKVLRLLDGTLDRYVKGL